MAGLGKQGRQNLAHQFGRIGPCRGRQLGKLFLNAQKHSYYAGKKQAMAQGTTIQGRLFREKGPYPFAAAPPAESDRIPAPGPCGPRPWLSRRPILRLHPRPRPDRPGAKRLYSVNRVGQRVAPMLWATRVPKAHTGEVQRTFRSSSSVCLGRRAMRLIATPQPGCGGRPRQRTQLGKGRVVQMMAQIGQPAESLPALHAEQSGPGPDRGGTQQGFGRIPPRARAARCGAGYCRTPDRTAGVRADPAPVAAKARPGFPSDFHGSPGPAKDAPGLRPCSCPGAAAGARPARRTRNAGSPDQPTIWAMTAREIPAACRATSDKVFAVAARSLAGSSTATMARMSSTWLSSAGFGDFS